MLLAQPRAVLRSEPNSTIPDTPMEIATEMPRLILEMRDGSQNEKRRKQRLVLLAEHFLRIIGQERGSDSVSPIENENRTPRSVTLTM